MSASERLEVDGHDIAGEGDEHVEPDECRCDEPADDARRQGAREDGLDVLFIVAVLASSRERHRSAARGLACVYGAIAGGGSSAV